jgi:hypothetical protein
LPTNRAVRVQAKSIDMTDIPEAALRARQMYLERKPLAEIKREAGLNLHKLYFWLAGGPEENGERCLAPIPLQRVHARSQTARAALVARIMKAAERQVRDIEDRLVVSGNELDSRLRNARALAVLVKTLNDLSAGEGRAPRMKKAKDENDAPVPRDIGELRRELARRLQQLVGQAKRDCPDEPAGTRS